MTPEPDIRCKDCKWFQPHNMAIINDTGEKLGSCDLVFHVNIVRESFSCDEAEYKETE